MLSFIKCMLIVLKGDDLNFEWIWWHGNTCIKVCIQHKQKNGIPEYFKMYIFVYLKFKCIIVLYMKCTYNGYMCVFFLNVTL